MAALAMGSTAALAIDPFFPSFGNDGIDVLHYNIGLDVDPVAGSLKGKTLLAIKAERRLTAFTLDLHGLTVSSVRVNGMLAQFTRNGDKLRIVPRLALATDSLFVVSVDYAGVPDALPDPTAPGQGLFLGWLKYRNSTYALSEPVGASTFFPANDEPTDKATYTIGITVPTGYRGVANGAPLGSLSFGVKTRFQWAMLQPMTSWLATVHVNKLNLNVSHSASGVPVRVYTPAGVPASHVAGYAKAAPMIDYFQTLIGRYPFASYGSIVVQDPILYYALETQAMSTFPEEAGQANPPGEDFVAHELAHQWFGDSVSVAHWEDLWFAEGSATYFELLWPNRYDPAAADAAMRANYDYVAQQQLGPAVVSDPVDLFSERVYLRGAAALYALQLHVGKPKFFRILRTFLRENRGGNITSAMFIDTAERVSGDGSVRPLLHAWIYDTAVPGIPGAVARRGPVAKPNVVGVRCGRRDAAKQC
jgi:aminopeptidase N